MIEKLMQASLRNRLIVLIAALGILIFGTIVTLKMPIDVFPDLTSPTVTILTEAHGMAPEEVEKLVTFPIETVVNGASGVRRVRSNSIQGLSTIWVEFEWGVDIYVARQIVNEKIQIMRNTLPEGVDQPILAPITSIMGEIMLVGLTSDSTSSMQLRTLADFTITRRIQSVPGVSQVLVYGGETQQYQVQVDPYKVTSKGLTLHHVLKAVAESNVNATGGVFIESGQEYLIRGIGRIRNIEDLKRTVVTTRDRVPILVKDVADVKIAPAFRLGTASVNNKDAVMLVIAKQPEANTLTLTDEILNAIEQIRPSLPGDVTLHTEIFKQSDFIETAVENVTHALRDGAILVFFILFFFLMNFRTTIISILAIPLSLIIGFLVLKALGLSVNTMTLGGMAIATGVLVDDAIIYVENVFRRIRQNSMKPVSERREFMEVVAAASSEIRAPIAMATYIVIVVFIPLFFLSGVEGRMLKPLGLAYTISIMASLLVAVTVTPALCAYFLRNVPNLKHHGDSWLVRHLKRLYEPSLKYFLQRKGLIIGASGALVVLALIILPFFGRSFLPEFNEGTFNISVATLPGTALQESDEIGKMVESILLSNEAVISTARRTGRTELDEHSLGSHAHELEVQIDLEKTSKTKLLEELRNGLSLVQGSNITIGQPISHRIDHMLSGTRAAIAVKLFGPDLYELRKYAEQIRQEMAEIEGIVDLFVDQQTDVPQVRIKANREKMAMYGLRPADLDELIDVAFLGVKTSQVYEGEHRHDLVVQYAPEFRGNLESIKKSLIDTPTGGAIPLEMIADIQADRGPNYISRENVLRKIVIQANVAERDLRGAVEEIREKIETNISLPKDYFVDFGGQFESEQEATRTVTLLSIVSIFAILVILYMEFGNFRQAILVMVNLPLALIGGIVSIFFTEGIISIASLVGFITLFGIAVRNGILLVSHYNYLIDKEGKSLSEAVVQGSMERLSPILMTALAAGLALIPLALASDKPGSEIQSPMAIVILGGLLTSTFLNLVVVPALFLKWGRKQAR
ncbi:MAG TPA: efflux RND transporter permease subunit [candidate division Zixibacteria bacterium]|nr:efflux RND transporter permease subunit [candidate division Zixibacteria bacterium]